jgi:uncharacterized surface protein with fasciclin (FAS1) repeats
MANIVKTAEQAGKFTTLLKAIEQAELADILNSPGPYTVFAPTDEAFAKLPEGTIESLTQDIPKLKRVVSYHVTFGDVRAEDLMEIAEAETVEGSIVAIDSSNGLKVNDAQVIESDVMADNGVIHVIDSVLIPGLLAAES